MTEFWAEPDTLEGETSVTRWIPIPIAERLLWEKNPKLHDMQKTVESIEKHGFRDKPAFDMNLVNRDGAKGAIVYGNGRIEGLLWMYRQQRDMPRGIMRDKSGVWHVPVEFGLDADSEAAAIAFGIDHNSLTLEGSSLQNYEKNKIYDEDLLQGLLTDVFEQEETTVTIDGDDLDDMMLDVQDMGKPAAKQEQGYFPLAIVLTAAQMQQWSAVKDKVGYSDDTRAFLKMIEGL